MCLEYMRKIRLPSVGPINYLNFQQYVRQGKVIKDVEAEKTAGLSVLKCLKYLVESSV